MEKGMFFIKTYGFVLLALFLGCAYTIYIASSIEDRAFYFDYLGIGTAIWYLITGIGILTRKKWGYYLLKIFLYVLLIAFPIGTLIGYKSLKYMKRNNIQKFFGVGDEFGSLCHKT